MAKLYKSGPQFFSALFNVKLKLASVNPSLNFASLNLGNFLFMYWKSASTFFTIFTELFTLKSLVIVRKKTYFFIFQVFLSVRECINFFSSTKRLNHYCNIFALAKFILFHWQTTQNKAHKPHQSSYGNP